MPYDEHHRADPDRSDRPVAEPVDRAGERGRVALGREVRQRQAGELYADDFGPSGLLASELGAGIAMAAASLRRGEQALRI